MPIARNRSNVGKGVPVSPYRKKMLAEREEARKKVLADAAQKTQEAVDKATIGKQAELEAARRQVETDLKHVQPDQLSEHAKAAIGLDEVPLEELREREHAKVMANQAETDEQKALSTAQKEEPKEPLKKRTPTGPTIGKKD